MTDMSLIPFLFAASCAIAFAVHCVTYIRFQAKMSYLRENGKTALATFVKKYPSDRRPLEFSSDNRVYTHLTYEYQDDRGQMHSFKYSTTNNLEWDRAVPGHKIKLIYDVSDPKFVTFSDAAQAPNASKFSLIMTGIMYVFAVIVAFILFAVLT